MKAISNATARFNGSIAPVLPAPARTGSRPVRRGTLWPGESFANNKSRLQLMGSFNIQTPILSVLVAHRGPQTH
jgi:hypothetical protein